MGSPDSHAVSEGQKSVGMPKTTRKGKERSAEKEKSAREKQTPRFEPQVGTHVTLSLLSRARWHLPNGLWGKLATRTPEVNEKSCPLVFKDLLCPWEYREVEAGLTVSYDSSVSTLTVPYQSKLHTGQLTFGAV